jgi:dephospho-CoA kinase
MLEHLGAYSIDADALSHRAISKGAPGYKPVVDSFGNFILDAGGEIDRAKLGRLVFSDPDALRELEAVVHPLVERAVDLMVKRASQRVVVIEAIKLLEGKLVSACDSIWVAFAPEELQEKRLVQKRGMSAVEARQRIHAQQPQDEKMAAANVVIKNTGSFEDTWKQVVAAWQVISPQADTVPVVMKQAAPGEFSVHRGRPHDSAIIADLVSRLSGGEQSPSQNDIMANFGEMAFLLLMMDRQLVGLAGWQVENLVARTTQLYLDPKIPLQQALKTLITELERASKDLQCEASLVFLPPEMTSQEGTWKELGYVRRSAQALGVQAWQDAAIESQPPDTLLLFKQLRQDRVLRPI